MTTKTCKCDPDFCLHDTSDAIPVDLPKVGSEGLSDKQMRELFMGGTLKNVSLAASGSFYELQTEAEFQIWKAGYKAGQSSTSFRAGAKWMREKAVKVCEKSGSNSSAYMIELIRAINIDAIAQSGGES